MKPRLWFNGDHQLQKPGHEFDEISPEMQKLRNEQVATQIAWRKRLAISDPAERQELEALCEQEIAEWQKKTGVRIFVRLAGMLDYIKEHKKSQS